jgi:hypothetical protein
VLRRRTAAVSLQADVLVCVSLDGNAPIPAVLATLTEQPESTLKPVIPPRAQLLSVDTNSVGITETGFKSSGPDFFEF